MLIATNLLSRSVRILICVLWQLGLEVPCGLRGYGGQRIQRFVRGVYHPLQMHTPNTWPQHTLIL